MTVKEAGELYTTLSQKIEEVDGSIKILQMELCDSMDGPLGPSEWVKIRRYALETIINQLSDYEKSMDYTMNKELSDL